MNLRSHLIKYLKVNPKLRRTGLEIYKNSICKKYILDPSLGDRRVTGALNRDGINVQRGLVRRLMKLLHE